LVFRSYRWPAVTTLLAVEGESDEACFKVLAVRCGYEEPGVIVLGKQGVLNPREIAETARPLLSKRSDITKVLVLVDQDCNPGRALQAQQTAEQLLQMRVVREVAWCVVQHELEGWFIADSHAINAVLKATTHPPDPQVTCKPSEWLKQAFRRAGRRYNKIIEGLSLAKEIELDVVAARNPSFACFRNALL